MDNHPYVTSNFLKRYFNEYYLIYSLEEYENKLTLYPLTDKIVV